MVMINMLIILPLMLILMSTPLMLMMGILLFSANSMFLKWLQANNPWPSLIFFLAFLGGMMIIFMYIVSISKMKKMKNKNKKMPFIFVLLFIITSEMITSFTSDSMNITYSNYLAEFMILSCIILLILMVSAKIVNSPFKALKSSF